MISVFSTRFTLAHTLDNSNEKRFLTMVSELFIFCFWHGFQSFTPNSIFLPIKTLSAKTLSYNRLPSSVIENHILTYLTWSRRHLLLWFLFYCKWIHIATPDIPHLAGLPWCLSCTCDCITALWKGKYCIAVPNIVYRFMIGLAEN